MWGYLKGQVEKPVLKELRPLRHLKETLVYFIPTIATSVYTILDKTMLGWFSGEISRRTVIMNMPPVL